LPDVQQAQSVRTPGVRPASTARPATSRSADENRQHWQLDAVMRAGRLEPAELETAGIAMDDRLPPIAPEAWTDEQRRYAQEIVDGPRGALISPFVPLLRSPELMSHVARLGEYLRYRSAIGLRLSELAILLTARQWTQQVEWAIHAPIAVREGISADTVDAIARGHRPLRMDEDEATVVDFCAELHRDRKVSDATWSRALQRLGEQGVMDLVAVVGYYTLLSMVMNVAGTAVPPSTADPLPPLPMLAQPRRT